MKKLSYFIAFAFLILAIQSCNNPRNQDSVSMAKDANEENDSLDYIDVPITGLSEFDNSTRTYNDSDFAVEAADGGMLEVQLGKIALTNASSQDVKDFAQTMLDDHTKINDELTALAQQKDIVLPPTPSQKNIDIIKNLNDKMGVDFDKEYIDHMVSDHEKDIDLFENAAQRATDDDIKAFANKTLPILRNHIAAAKVVKDSL